MLKMVDKEMKDEVRKSFQAAQSQIDTFVKAFDACSDDAPGREGLQRIQKKS